MGNAKQEYDDLDIGFTTLSLQPDVCQHWAEKNFGIHNELMTPTFEKDVYQPLSRVTVGALEDLGYQVNYAAADPFFLQDAAVENVTRAKTSFNLDQQFTVKRPSF